MNRRTALKAMMGGGIGALGCQKEPLRAKMLTKADMIKLIFAIREVESRGDWHKVGKAEETGAYQITKQYVDDVNRIVRIKKLPFGEYRYRMRSKNGYCHTMMQIYWDHYATIERLGHEPTLEDLARIHNGGPDGWKKAATKEYWNKVKKEIENDRRKSNA